ncbi:hypothetical protein Leryth_015874 [Lithospermum erythrorhizon]|nr:hypothetical protein Leryth_015874 [Lithospermum erythrorhizon]
MANLPPVPEMIMTAIKTLNEKTGSEKSTIQTHIESNYTSLPVDFPDLLSTHLEELKQNGQLTMVNDCYKKVDSDVEIDVTVPLRRGRGRPPKPKPALPSGYEALPARPRGRPPKPHDPLAGGSGRKRGRPPKAGKPRGGPVSVTATGEKRGRGRPPKARTAEVAPIDIEVANGGT